MTNVSLKMTITHASSPGIRVIPLTFLIHMNIFRNQTVYDKGNFSKSYVPSAAMLSRHVGGQHAKILHYSTHFIKFAGHFEEDNSVFQTNINY